jgi:hypothetical protein
MSFLVFQITASILTIIVIIAIAALLWRHFRDMWIARRNMRAFAATLPENEREQFWHIYRSRKDHAIAPRKRRHTLRT